MTTMRAVVHERYGPPDVLRVADDVPRPAPADDEVLVRVVASTVTRADVELRNLTYWFSRLFTGLRRPRRTVAGTEFAGVVEAAGRDVTDLVAGDDVYGIDEAANAEYMTVRAGDVVARMPRALTHEQAAAVPDGALLALTCLRPAYPLRGKRVLVYGAGGSIGTAAVQLLAHHFEAEVTAVCETHQADLVRELGAAAVVDRHAEDFTRGGATYDVVFDAVGKHSFRRSRRALAKGGIYVTTGLGYLYHAPLVALATRWVGSRRGTIGIGTYRREDLDLVTRLVDAGLYRPVVDRTYAMEDAVEANRYVESWRKTGSVVLRVARDE